MACDGPCASPLSFGALEQLWIDAGGPTGVAPVAAAIAEAESYGGVANAVNPTDNGGTQTSWGLWQISDGTHNAFTDWSTPLTNAKAAVQKYKNAGGFSPWGTFTSGTYLAHLQDANANGTIGSGGTTPTTPTGSSAASAFSPTALSSQSSTIIIVFAALVLLIGIWAMTRPGAPQAAPAT